MKAVARLESAGWIKRLEEQAQVDPELRTGLRRAHEEYARERGRVHRGADAWGGVGGATRGVKCLHAHYAYHLAGGLDPIGEWVANQLGDDSVHYEKPGRRLAGIDLGTNSIRLLVGRVAEADGSFRELARDMVITRIGEGVDRTGRISPEALRRTLPVLERYGRRAVALGAERVHLVATSAVRDASNRDELARAVLRATGEPMEIASTLGLDGKPPYLVLDIGGGSTEFVLGTQEPSASVSAQIGSVRLTERYVHTDPPSYDELDKLELTVTSVLHQVEDRIPVHDANTLIPVGGTATTIQAIAQGLPEYDPEVLHRSVLPRSEAERVFRLLADMTTAERRAIPVMAPGREDVIPAGAAILVGVMQRWGFTEALVSETDILDGIVARMAVAEPGSGR